MRGVSVVKQHSLVRKMLYSNKKLHVSASNGHHQVSRPIKKILYICVWECWCRDLYASSPLCYCRMHIYKTNRKTVFSKGSVDVSITPRGCTNTGGRV